MDSSAVKPSLQPPTWTALTQIEPNSTRLGSPTKSVGFVRVSDKSADFVWSGRIRVHGGPNDKRKMLKKEKERKKHQKKESYTEVNNYEK